MRTKAMLVMLLSAALVCAPVSPAGTAAAVGKVTTKGAAELNGAAAPAETTVFNGDRISTREKAVATLWLTGGDQLFLTEQSAGRLSRDQADARTEMALERGGLVLMSRGAQPVSVLAAGLRIVPSGAGIFEIVVQGNTLKVAARKGSARVTASNRSVDVPEGKTLDATVDPPQGPAGAAALTTMERVAIFTGLAAGLVGLTLGAIAISRPNPSDCKATGAVSPFTITCP